MDAHPSTHIQSQTGLPDQEMYVLPVLGCIAFLLLTAFVRRLPYAAYEWLRIIICCMSGWLAFESLRLKRQIWGIALAANAIFFNFLIPIRMNRAHWKIADLVSAGLLAVWAGYIMLKKSPTP